MKYSEAMENYGSDKPDLRFAMPLVDVIDIFANSTNEILLILQKIKKQIESKLSKFQMEIIFSKKDK